MIEYPLEFLELLAKIKAKRAKTVIDHILKHGHITTEELKDIYGYNHPPRAARDVREQGIPLETIKMPSTHGRSIGAYKFGDLSKVAHHKIGGRQIFSKNLRRELLNAQSGQCAVCHQKYEQRYLQIDHRIPYEVAGDAVSIEAEVSSFMLICASCQRSKSWSCEHCDNLINQKDGSICKTCYWGTPEDYEHIALNLSRREVLTWVGNEVENYDKIAEYSNVLEMSVAEYIKNIVLETH